MLTKLPIFSFADKSLMQWQTQWAKILNPLTNLFNRFNAFAPTQQILTQVNGIYNTPANAFYLHLKMSATSGVTSFGSSYLSATSGSGTIPNAINLKAFYFTANNVLDAIITNPNPSYPYSLASSGYIVVREFYQ